MNSQIDDTLLRLARNLKRAVAPELPCFYLLAAAELHGVLPPVREAFGWQSRFHPDIRQMLLDRFEWRGIMPIIVLDVAAIRDAAADLPNTATELSLTVFLHELTHALPFAPHSDVPPGMPPALLQKFRDRFAECAEHRPTPVPWFDHGIEFTRRALHLHHRAAAAGFDLPLEPLAAGWTYRLSPIREYSTALGDEPARLAGLSFAEIEATDPPQQFTALFEADCAAYQESLQKEVA